jgi:hypothetical protein
MAATRRTADQLALGLFAQLRDKSEADRQLVYRALVRRFAVRRADRQLHRDPDRVEWALEALWECEDWLGELPSKHAYSDWRSERGESAGWPSAGFIVNTFGSWAEAAAAAGGAPTMDPLARRLLANGPRFEEDELIALLQRAGRDLRQDWLTFDVYRDWAARVTARRDPRFRRVALSHGPFRRCGGWSAAVRKAGLRPGGPGYSRDATTDSSHLSDGQLLQAVREEARRVRGRLTFTGFDELRKARERRATARDQRLPSVRAKRLVDRFGSWADVLFKAGLVTDEERRFRSCEGQYRIDERGALTLLGGEVRRRGRLSPGDYLAWRRLRILAGDPRRLYPSRAWLVSRFGDWSSVLSEALKTVNAHRGEAA